METLIIQCAPFIIWALNAKWKAGETLMSEYVLIIGLRWTIVLIFQFPLLWSCCSTVASAIDLLFHGLRKLATLLKKRGRNRNDDGTFSVEEEGSNNKRRGRPPKRHA